MFRVRRMKKIDKWYTRSVSYMVCQCHILQITEEPVLSVMNAVANAI